MNAVLEKIYSYEGEQRNMLLFLHEYFLSFPHISARLNFKIPFYYQKSWITYTNPIKRQGVELVFLRGKDLLHHPQLDAKGRKLVAGISYYSANDIDIHALEPIWCDALALEQMKKK